MKNLEDTITGVSTRQPNLLMEFQGDWLYLKDSKPINDGYQDTYNFRDGSLVIEYVHDEFQFKWGTHRYA